MNTTKQTPATESETISRASKVLVWIVSLVIVCALFPKAEREMARMSETWAKQKPQSAPQSAPLIPRVNLRCGKGTNKVLAGLGRVPKAALILPPGDCWSEKVVLPKNLWQLAYDSREEIGGIPQKDTDPTYAVVTFADQNGNKFDDGPAMYTHHEAPPPRKLRLKNLTENTVVVTLSFVY